jgi:DNA-binding GntR family transcriptional regulator
VGSLEYHRHFRKHRGKLREEIKVRYRLPSLLARRVWDVAAYHSRLGWRVNLQTYRTVSQNEEIFEVARKGDLERMRELLSAHGGYVNDRYETGWTPLHVSC